MKRTLLAAALLMALAAPAFASQCPGDMGKIDAALAQNPALSAEQLAEVQKLRADGEAMHAAGKHKDSVDALGKAKAILGIE